MGHKRTIRPNARKLNALFSQREKMPWTTFSRKVKSAQREFMGEPDDIKPGRTEFHEYPSSCICKKPLNFSLPDNKRITTNASSYGHNEGVNSRDNDASSSLEEKEDDDFLAD
ncbi:hypothetical protein M8C21_018767 [Ambrosia artemisiifolia]|uniref:Uncharacterized protein n=1 Tax=Ambrosia artemisiifolia TaxID=4212 RepID=A0AAD5D179_AMBAR|nr:hypothetical protein M8C21_018767 [Ambrosia artemisiifolia]